jgi:hypothetical protein
MNKLVLLVGPPGSGKSSYAKMLVESSGTWNRVSQDDQGKGHLAYFNELISMGSDIIVDRMGFDRNQRNRYLDPARKAGYEIEIVVFHVPRDICFERIMGRQDHPTINGYDPDYGGGCAGIVRTEEEELEHQKAEAIRKIQHKAKQANSALDTFFTKYERVEDTEANKVVRLGWNPDIHKTLPVMIVDLDGTLCNIDHRLHHVRNDNKKKRRWDLFFKEVPGDSVNEWCKLLINRAHYNPVILCSGRPDSTRKDTEAWLMKHGFAKELYVKENGEKVIDRRYRHLFMRHRTDHRQDSIVKEIILEFEIKTRYNVWMAVDDRKQVVDMWRKHGITCLQCAEGDF